MRNTRQSKKLSKASADDVDSPEITKEMFRRMRPAAEVMPEIVKAYRRSRGAQKAPTKVPVSLRLSPDVLAHFKSTGAGWQTRLDDALRLLVGRGHN